MPSAFSEKTASPFRPGMRPEAKFSGKENSIVKCCLAGIVLYCWPSPAATATCSVDFSSNKDVGIRNHTRARFPRRRLLLSCKSETV